MHLCFLQKKIRDYFETIFTSTALELKNINIKSAGNTSSLFIVPRVKGY